MDHEVGWPTSGLSTRTTFTSRATPRGQSLNKQTSKMKSLGATFGNLRPNFKLDGDDDHDEGVLEVFCVKGCVRSGILGLHF